MSACPRTRHLVQVLDSGEEGRPVGNSSGSHGGARGLQHPGDRLGEFGERLGLDQKVKDTDLTRLRADGFRVGASENQNRQIRMLLPSPAEELETFGRVARPRVEIGDQPSIDGLAKPNLRLLEISHAIDSDTHAPKALAHEPAHRRVVVEVKQKDALRAS